jgi:hypothetical protein
MAATMNWTISTLERELSDGGVIVAHWRCNASETVGTGDDAVDYSASSYGTAGFTYDASSEDFVAYEDLTETDVLAWVWESVDKEATEEALAAQLDAAKNPTSAAGTPW